MQRGVKTKSFCVFIITCIFILPFVPESKAQLYGNKWTGPWLDRIDLEVIMDETQQILALIDDEVDIIGNQIDSKFVEQLEEMEIENIRVYENLRFGYGLLYFDCSRYPMNITAFRRALAFAIDKYKISDDVWSNHSIPLDCHIPTQHPACIENDMNYHYYDKQINKGIELLEAAGFIDSDDDGWREGPGFEGPGTVELERLIVLTSPWLSHEQNKKILDEIIQSLVSLGFDATWKYYYDAYPISGLDCPIVRNYHMWLGEKDWDSFDLDHYAKDMSSDYLEVIGYNFPNWSNESWDTYVPTVLSSLDYEEILLATKEMESVWVHACPAVILYQNSYYTACRTDCFQGEIFSNFLGITNLFTNLRIHQTSDEAVGGTYVWGISRDTYTFNHFSINLPQSNAFYVLQMLFDPLVRIGPNHEDILWMCESYEVQTHDDDSTIPEGHTRYIVDIIKNASWNDGTPVTAHDFIFTFSFIRDHVSIQRFDLLSLSKYYCINDHRFVCEFDTESYWNWHSIAYKSVIPRQVWNNYSQDYNEYQPTPATLNDMVTSGPFFAGAWVQGDFVELKQNPYYWKNPRNIKQNSTTNLTTSSETTTEHTIQIVGLTTVMLGSFICVITVGILLIRIRESRG